MDDLAETVLLNMLRGAGLDGLSPMVNDPTKPLRDLRRSALHEFVDSTPSSRCTMRPMTAGPFAAIGSVTS